MPINPKRLLELRNLTGAGMNDCQTALTESGGNLERAIEILRKKGAVKAAKKLAERTANQGLITAYIHANGKVGVLVELSCETDFVARNREFKDLAYNIAMQVAATNPLYLTPQTIPADVLEKEKEIYREPLKKEGKPEKIIDKVILGKLEKYYEEVCLMNQLFIKDDQITIKELVELMIAKFGEKIEVKRFARFGI